MTTPRPGRPRSDAARGAVLRAVDDLLVDVGYAQVTMKAIAERAGVSRQTVYRWWSSPAEVLREASATDAVKELDVPPGTPLQMARDYLDRLAGFLTGSDAGLAYRALLGAAQHDADVARLLRRDPDVLATSARPVVRAALGGSAAEAEVADAAAALIGPVLFEVLTTGAVDAGRLPAAAERWTAEWAVPPAADDGHPPLA